MGATTTGQAEARLVAALSMPAIHYRTNVLIERAAHLVEGREPKVLARIAAYMERVIERQLTRDAKANPDARHFYSDVDLWLRSGGQDRTPPARSGVPADVTRSEYLATMAVWKAGNLGRFTVNHLFAQIRRPDVPRDADTLLDRLVRDGFEAEPLLVDIAQAAILALEARFFDLEIARAREAGAIETERALRHAQDIHVRAAGSLGGLAKKRKYDPARYEAIRLYKAGAGAGNRAAAVREIVPLLEAKGLHSHYEFVMSTLKKHDKALRDAQSGRLSAPGGSQRRSASEREA